MLNLGRRRIQKAPITTLAISLDTAEIISRVKCRKETQDGFIRRMLAEWEDLKDYRLDMDQVIKLKDRQILRLENELKDKLQNPSF